MDTFKLTVTTNQQAFDAVKAHLAKMPRRAVDEMEGVCSYFTSDGIPCAVGALVDDPQGLQHAVTGYGNGDTSAITLADIGIIDTGDVNLRLLNQLQQIHDAEDNWGDDGFNNWIGLDAIKQRFNLN